MTGICSVDGCGSETMGNRKHCGRHATRLSRHGKIISVGRMLAPRIGERKKGGYVYLLKKDHPSADKRGYVKRSWIVWEQNTGHIVTPPEVVHHKNEIRSDDAFDNLELLPDKPSHVRRHGGRIGGIRIVTKQMACLEMARVSALIAVEKLTTRKFEEHSTVSSSAIKGKFGWSALKEEMCIR